MMGIFDDAREFARNTEDAFEKARLDQCSIEPEVGDTVVVNARLLGMGHEWIRYSARVIAVGQQSYHVEFLDYMSISGKSTQKWVHPAVITDVIRQKKEDSDA